MTYTHTFSTGSVDLILAAVFLLHGNFLELVGDVVGGSAVDVPIRVDAVGPISRRSNLVIVLGIIIILLVPVPAIPCCVSRFPADLASWSVGARPVAAATTATAAASAARALRRGAAVTAAAATRSPFVSRRAT